MRNVLLGCDRLLTEIPDGGYNRCDTQEQLFEEGCTNESSMTRNKKYKKKGVYYVVPTPTKKFLKKVLDNNIYTFYG